MNKRRPARIDGIVHRVKFPETITQGGRTSCSLWFTGHVPWYDWIKKAEIVLEPIDCMACIAAEAS